MRFWRIVHSRLALIEYLIGAGCFKPHADSRTNSNPYVS